MNLCKKLVFIFSVILVVLSIQVSKAEASTPIVNVDGQRVNFSGAQPQLLNGSTYVPVRAISESMGLDVEWTSNIDQRVIFTNPYKPEFSVRIRVNSSTIEFLHWNNITATKQLSVPVRIIDGTTMVPIRFFEIAFDAKVVWQSTSSPIEVYTKQLRDTQRLILSSLVYSNVDSVNGGTSLGSIKYDANPEFKNFLDDFTQNITNKSRLSQYTEHYQNGVTKDVNAFMKYYLMDHWEVSTFLDSSDELYSGELKISGFNGIAFYNNMTNEYVIAIRGSNNLWDFYATNFQYWINSYNNQEKYALRLYNKLMREKNPNSVGVTGHSLGGMLSQYLAKSIPNLSYGITFNAPGNSARVIYEGNRAKITNYMINTDYIAKTFYPDQKFGQVVGFDMPVYVNDLTSAAHRQFNFYRYFYSPKTTYWNAFLPK